MASSGSPTLVQPDLIHGVPSKASPLQSSKFNFMPSLSTSTGSFIPSRESSLRSNSGNFKIRPSPLSTQYSQAQNSRESSRSFQPNLNKAAGISRPLLSKRKTVCDAISNNELLSEPQRKVHLNEELVAQTMSQLYISHPRPKVARRTLGSDVAETINLSSLEDLEDKFSHQAAITNCDDFPLPPQRSRKLPTRSKIPQLRVSLHQELRGLRSPGLLPESLVARYRPAARGSSTALVLWKPPGGSVPDIISSALMSGPGSSGFTSGGPVTARARIRCYSEVTSTPYSSHENLTAGLLDTEQVSRSSVSPLSPHSQHSPTSAEAPELSSIGEVEEEIPLGVNIQRRNSAPEISEPMPFVDECSMEL